MSDKNQEPPKIEFPCEDYPIKVLGDSSGSFREEVVTIIEVHAPGIDAAKITTRNSSKGTFNSVTVYITATGVPQLEAIHEDLKKHPQVKMVL